MLNFLEVTLPIIINFLLIILLIVGIILSVKLILTINKVNKIVDDVSVKVSKLNGLFNVIDFTTDKINQISDTVVGLFTNLIGKVSELKNKKSIREEDKDE